MGTRLARPCSVDGCTVTVSEAQDFCARCWNNVPPKDQYMVQVARERVNDAKVFMASALSNARALAAQRLHVKR